jgi:hypothetical protein
LARNRADRLWSFLPVPFPGLSRTGVRGYWRNPVMPISVVRRERSDPSGPTGDRTRIVAAPVEMLCPIADVDQEHFGVAVLTRMLLPGSTDSLFGTTRSPRHTRPWWSGATLSSASRNSTPGGPASIKRYGMSTTMSCAAAAPTEAKTNPPAMRVVAMSLFMRGANRTARVRTSALWADARRRDHPVERPLVWPVRMLHTTNLATSVLGDERGS